MWVWLVAVGYVGLATSQTTAAPSSHHTDDLFPTDDAHSHLYERNCNQWCCAWYVTGPFVEWGRAGGLMIDVVRAGGGWEWGSSGPALWISTNQESTAVQELGHDCPWGG